MRSTGKVLHEHGYAVFQAARATALLLAVLGSKGIYVVFGRRTRDQRFFTPVETVAPPVARLLYDFHHRANIRQNKLGNRGKLLGAISDDPLQPTPMSDGPLPLKRDVAKMLLRKGSLFVHLDPRASDVFVPPWLRHQAQLVLQVGFDMPIPIPDLRVDDEGVFGTLSFSRNPFTCAVPWHSVFALVGDEGRGMVWPESMPPEIAAEVEREANRSKLAGDQGRDADLRPAGVPTDIGAHTLRSADSRGTRILREGPYAEIPGPKEREAAVLRAAEPNARARRDSSRPVAMRSGGRRRALPPYLRVVK